MKKNITLMRRILLNQVYMMRSTDNVIQKENDPIANSEALYLQTFESASATAQELKEVTTVDQNRQRTTPPEIKFTQQLSGFQSFGIRNGEKSLVFEIKEKDWRVIGDHDAGLCGLRISEIISEIKTGDLIYTSNRHLPEFNKLSQYYLCVGPKQYAFWNDRGGVEIIASTATHVWRIGK